MKRVQCSIFMLCAIFASVSLFGCGNTTENSERNVLGVKFTDENGDSEIVELDLNNDPSRVDLENSAEFTIPIQDGGAYVLTVDELVSAPTVDVLMSGIDGSRLKDGDVKSRVCGCRASLTDPMPANPCSCSNNTCMCVTGRRPTVD